MHSAGKSCGHVRSRFGRLFSLTLHRGQTLIEPTLKLAGAVWDKEQVVGNLPGGHQVVRLSRSETRSKTFQREALRDDIPEGPAVSLKLLGSFSLKAGKGAHGPTLFAVHLTMPGTTAGRLRPTSTHGLPEIGRHVINPDTHIKPHHIF